MRTCDKCGRRIWPGQKWSGVGPFGFRLRTASAAWHNKCLRDEYMSRHSERGCTSVCRLLGCPEES